MLSRIWSWKFRSFDDAGILDQPVGKGRLPVVDMGDNAEIPDMVHSFLASGELRHETLGDFLHTGRAVHFQDLGAFLEVMNGGHRSRLCIVIDAVPFVDRRFVLVVGPGGQLVAAADPADHLSVLHGRFDGVDIDVVRMVVVGGAEPAAHDSLFGDLDDRAGSR